MVADSAQSYIEHGHNAVAERFMAIERYRTEELLQLPSCVGHRGSNMFEVGSIHLARVLQLGIEFVF